MFVYIIFSFIWHYKELEISERSHIKIILIIDLALLKEFLNSLYFVY
jgi:hypothetical protein